MDRILALEKVIPGVLDMFFIIIPFRFKFSFMITRVPYASGLNC